MRRLRLLCFVLTGVASVAGLVTCMYDVPALLSDGGVDDVVDVGEVSDVGEVGTAGDAGSNATPLTFCGSLDANVTLCESFDETPFPQGWADGGPGWSQNSPTWRLDDASFVSSPYSLLVTSPEVDASRASVHGISYSFGQVSYNELDLSLSLRLPNAGIGTNVSFLNLIFWSAGSYPGSAFVFVLGATSGQVEELDWSEDDAGRLHQVITTVVSFDCGNMLGNWTPLSVQLLTSGPMYLLAVTVNGCGTFQGSPASSFVKGFYLYLDLGITEFSGYEPAMGVNYDNVVVNLL